MREAFQKMWQNNELGFGSSRVMSFAIWREPNMGFRDRRVVRKSACVLFTFYQKKKKRKSTNIVCALGECGVFVRMSLVISRCGSQHLVIPYSLCVYLSVLCWCIWPYTNVSSVFCAFACVRVWACARACVCVYCCLVSCQLKETSKRSCISEM